MTDKISAQNLETIRANIKQYSPHPEKVQIVAVTKTLSHKSIENAISNNIKCIGENKVQEFYSKRDPNFKSNYQAHLIGHLQSNKINRAIDIFDVIETIDTIKLAQKMNQKLYDKGYKKEIYIQINIGNDFKKFGFKKEEALQASEIITGMENLKLKGVMTILPLLDNNSSTEKLFSQTQKLCNQINEKINKNCTDLSMGMSGDYIFALKHGSTHIRIGTMLYGNR
tara:strand:+ start:250 stop:927 length:678 start_codon:yes stop_codon:yes gene_type:complete